jgi:hypothetical protein
MAIPVYTRHLGRQLLSAGSPGPVIDDAGERVYGIWVIARDDAGPDLCQLLCSNEVTRLVARKDAEPLATRRSRAELVPRSRKGIMRHTGLHHARL